MAERPRLRERKRQRTRDTIVRAAIDLFSSQGYQQTTIAAIADRAEVAVSTVFAYFPTKEDLVFHFFPDLQASFARRLSLRPDGEGALDAAREWLTEEFPTIFAPESADLRTLRAVVNGDERLLAQERYRLGYFEEVLAMALAADRDESPDSLYPRLIAGAAVGATLALLTHKRPTTVAELREQIAATYAFIAAGMRTIGL